MIDYYVPPDNEDFLNRWREIGGVCGPACIATLEQTSIEAILGRWLGVGLGAFRGFSPIAEMKAMLNREGWMFKYVRGGKAKVFPTPSTDLAIVRVQWLKDDGTEYYWRAAGAHTHYVLMQKIDGAWFIFCNDVHWFPAHGTYAKNYLSLGFVSSYMELTKA